ncbi:hypothetical protein BU23DRAFT_569412 [Bimuria novae-zelandiae CBS 107.79]|uniref:Uncharacterized protein n=1 Tax=Bimuria novae-zelandiae CBS 107.79 TaxID=1447943 RepID=A0A6A5V4W8_9PLEO|nr:hypothetical protein BU23DRAFT_569412 [Bimuria novae-zelandiae CBS 107.79]
MQRSAQPLSALLEPELIGRYYSWSTCMGIPGPSLPLLQVPPRLVPQMTGDREKIATGPVAQTWGDIWHSLTSPICSFFVHGIAGTYRFTRWKQVCFAKAGKFPRRRARRPTRSSHTSWSQTQKAKSTSETREANENKSQSKKLQGDPKNKQSKTSVSPRPKETSKNQQNKAVVFPKTKVPYVDTAIKLCGLWINFQEDAGSSSRNLNMSLLHAVSRKSRETLAWKLFSNNTGVREVTQMALIKNRTPRPAYRLGTRPVRDSFGSLIWEALDSTANPTDFVVCQKEINGYKTLLWQHKNPMAPDKFTGALKGAIDGTLNSRVYLSALRTVSAFYHYINSPTVHHNLQSINVNVRTELGHASTLTGQQNVNLVPIWDAFLNYKFTEVEDWGKEWLNLRIEESLKAIEKTRKKYRPLLTDL